MINWGYCHECGSDEGTTVRTDESISFICSNCQHTETLTKAKPLKWFVCN